MYSTKEVSKSAQKGILSSKHHSVTYDEAIHLCGGFGRFQVLATAIFTMTFTMGGQIIYGLTFMNKRPVYICSLVNTDDTFSWQPCSAEQICDIDLKYGEQWSIDYSSTDSYRNWVDPSNMDLTCVPDHVIGMVGSAFFLGWMISSMFLPAWCDKSGRRWPLFWSCMLQVVCQAFNLFSKSIHLTIISYFFVGVSTSLRIPFTLSYVNEIIPETQRTQMTTFLCMLDALSMVFQAIYYSYNPDMYPLHSFLLVLAFFSTLSILWLPDSPKFFYVRNRFDEAKESLSQIAKCNGKQWNQEIQFDNETTDLHSKSESTDQECDSQTNDDDYQESENVQRLTGDVSEIFTVRPIRRNFLIIMLQVTVSSICFYTINLNMKNVQGSMIVNILSSQVAEICAAIASNFLFTMFGARLALFSSYSLCVFGSFCLICVQMKSSNIEVDPLQIALFVAIAKFGASASFTMNFVSFVELTPSIFTATIMGYSNVTKGFFSIFAPQLAELHGNTPNIILVVLASSAAICSLFIITKLPKFI